MSSSNSTMSPNNALPEKAFRRSSFTLSMASTQSPSSASSCASSDKYADTVENYKEISGMSENDSISKVPDTPDSSCVGISVASDGKETDDSQSASSDWSDSDSDDEDNYEELMASLPIAFGRSLERTPKPPKDALTKSQKVAFPQLQNTSKATSKENFFTFNPTCTPTNGRLGGNIASEYGRDAGGLQSESHKLSLSVASDCSCCGSDDDEFECKELMAELPVTLGSSEERASATPPVMAPCPVPVSFISALDEHYKSVDLMVNDDYVTSAGKRKTKSDASASDRLTSSAACDWSGSGTEIPTALGRTKEQRKKQGTAAHPRLQTEGPSSVQVSSFVRSEENGTKSVEIDPTIYLARAPFDGPLAVCNTASHNGDDEGTQGESEWGGSCTCSSNWSSGDDDVDDEYEKLLAELPIDVGRSKEQPKRHTITASHSDQSGKVAPSEKDWACIADLTEFSKDCEEFHNSFNKHPNLKVVHSSSDDTHQGSSISSHDGKIDCRSQGESDRGTSSAYSSYCSGNGDEDGFEDLMSELPIALGPSRKHTKKNSVSSGKLQILSSDQAPSCIITSLEDFKSADVRPVVKLSYPAPPPEVMNPMEGLTMFQHIRSDLEKVGRMIVAQKDGELFLQRARILASINWLAASVPTCVLDHLGREIRLSLQAKSEAKDKDERFNSLDISDDVSEASTLSDSDDGGDNSVVDQYPVSSLNDKKQRKACRRVSYIGTMDVEGIDTKGSTVPYVCYFKGAVMFVDISGFTKLSTTMDPESLSKIINSYFQQIVDKINEYGGDVQKYAGDAIFAEWRVSSIITLEECVAAAAACSVSIVKDCANFSVMSLTGKFDTVSSAPSLNVHCGLGVGRLAGLHIGDNTHRREYLYLGDPITQATVACAHAELGEVVASPQFQKILTSLGLDGAAINEHRHEAKFVLANRDTVYVNVEKQESLITSRNAKPRGITDHVDGLHVDALIEYRRLMSLYAHPVVVSNDVAASNNFKLSTRSGTNQQHNREDAELRSVYIMFINPLVDLHLSGDAERDWKYVVLVNNIMNLVTRELNHHAGHLRQCIVDDKGLVLIATFGLRGSTFPNMVTERALPATFAVSRALEIELGVKSKIGATFGDVYCGAVGGELRHEYAVLGVSCNLAARLMCSPANPGILVDDAVRQIADQAYCFNALDPVKAKGYSQPVPIFEPRAPLVHAWGKIEGNFVGRRDEILKLTTIASEMMHTEFAAPKIAIILSPSGMGKSTLLAHLVEHVRRVLRAKRGKGPVIAKHACRECDLQVPFSTIRSLLPSMLASFEAPVDDPTNRSGCSSSYSDVFSLGYNSISAFSVFEDATATGSGSHMHATFEKICKELQLPESIFEFLKFHLLGIEVNHFFGGNTKVPSMRSIAVFVSQIFVTCCRDSSLVLVAVDDIHRTDEMSWLVLQQVFETAVNVLIVGSAHSAADLSLRIDRNFWTLLNESSARKGRFVRMAIERLSEGDIVSMIMKTFGLQSKDVEGSDILKEVLVQSGGSPHFAQKILDGIRQRCVSSQPDGSETDNAITEIVLHRVDSFDFAVRSILNVGAVLGLSFTLGGVLSVLEETNDAKDADLRRQTIVSLQFLVNEGILYLGQRGARSGLKQANIVDDCSTTFSFCQNVWRSTVLRLMLGSRKRDVHKMIAISMECAADENALSVDYMKKLFVHWHGAGDARKMASVALSINKLHMNDTEHLPESIRLYEETLKVWGFTPTCEQCSDGFAWKIMSVMSPSDLSKIISVLVAQGRALALCGRQKESITAYGNVLRIRGGAKAYSSIEDRSVTFPAFVGICDAVADGHVDQDVYRRYEQKLIFQFLDETSTQGCLVHQIHALYLQMNVFMQLGDFDKAMAAYLIITQTYNPDMHSTGLRNLYGKDSGALSFALSSYLLMTRGDSPQALKTCRYVLKEIYPKIETDLAQSFAMIYPLVLVMKDGGYNDGAWILFEKTVVKPFDENRQGQSILSSVYRPLAMMLAIAGKAEVNEGTLLEYSKWACDAGNLCFGARINLHLGRLGRCADSIGAEICTSLAMKLRKGPCRNSLVAQGKCLVEKSSDFLRKHRLNSAMEQLYQVRSQLENVAGYNPHDEFHNQDLIHSMDDVGTFIKEQLQI